MQTKYYTWSFYIQNISQILTTEEMLREYKSYFLNLILWITEENLNSFLLYWKKDEKRDLEFDIDRLLESILLDREGIQYQISIESKAFSQTEDR